MDLTFKMSNGLIDGSSGVQGTVDGQDPNSEQYADEFGYHPTYSQDPNSDPSAYEYGYNTTGGPDPYADQYSDEHYDRQDSQHGYHEPLQQYDYYYPDCPYSGQDTRPDSVHDKVICNNWA